MGERPASLFLGPLFELAASHLLVMLFLALPNELIAKVLRFVTPPLPVPTSTTTFLPEVLQARGDNEGEWKDIGSLMLDSKAMKVRGILLEACEASPS